MTNATDYATIVCSAANGTNATNCSEMAGVSHSDDVLLLYQAAQRFLYTKVLCVIVFVGLFGNLTSIYLIVADRQMRNVSSSIYLLSVLSSDTGMLMSLFLVWLESLGYPLNHLPGVCRTSVYLTYVCGFLSIWYVVCITVETFITICHPTRIKQMCTLFRARVVAIVLLLTALMLYVISPIITEVQPVFYPSLNGTRDQCQTLPQHRNIATVVSYTDTVLTLVLPFLLLIILLTLITLAIIRSIRKKKKRSIKQTIENGGAPTTNRSKLPQVRVAKMLFILSVSVVVLTAPSHVIRLRWMFVGQEVLRAIEGFLHLIFLFISYCSFSVKFFICTACSENFRKLLINHCFCCKRKRYHSVPQQTMETAT